MRYLLILLCLSCATESEVATWDTEIERDTTTVQTGANSILFVAGETGAIRSGYRPVIPGHPYRAFAGIRDDDSGDAGDKLHLYIEWFTSAKVSISADDVWPDSWPNTNDVWEEVSVIADAPATAAFCQLIADKTADSANGQEMWADHFEIQPFPYAFRAYLDSDQSVPAGATQIAYTHEEYDHGGWFDLATDKATVPEDGIYTFTTAARIEDLDANEYFLLRLHRGAAAGTAIAFSPMLHSWGANEDVTNILTLTRFFSKGDVIAIYSTHSHGANLNISGEGAGIYTWFSGQKVE